MGILRAVMLLALIVWIGGIIFFSFVVAPTLFTILPTTTMAGGVVSVALSRLHVMGMIAGIVFLICSFIYNWLRYAQLRLFNPVHIFMVLMIILTAISQFVVTPRIRSMRADPSSVTAQDDFARLHRDSVRLEGGTLLCGLAVIILTSRRFGNS